MNEASDDERVITFCVVRFVKWQNTKELQADRFNFSLQFFFKINTSCDVHVLS